MMESRLLLLGLLSFITVPSCCTEVCVQDPPKVAYATFKALAYKNGTILNCECKRGFRRINELVYVVCIENSWSNNCQCTKNSNNNRRKQVTPKPEDQKEQQITEMQKSTQSVHQENLPGQRVHYECIQGYKALQRGPAVSICKMMCGKTGWTQPQLTCVDKREHHQFPAREDSPFPESETSCPITTTDLQPLTEAVTTMETFILTMEYQLAVAGCVFLLISILLLSGLTWRRRWKKNRRTI
uniref:interleukin-2 receptor subunit alpha isoform X2 n=1 Tax=Myodes glareolus TaxID=447135 RepID=UPI002020994D|nr:interleukin-2 receptor subunit alpha isoform X2 [Myodes glareolus]